ncbi:Hypothetical protein PHPALM_923 [Phytophthora palmivora]|uniref:MULE transposase domain-containing protein n=1 Tax=Phytophthora palmivora TaxID=4796 RepID=A0A2P4YTL3_9STRA|nr:Hypothetical protein PHPALM_923 [Phytophthora palmivora]
MLRTVVGRPRQTTTFKIWGSQSMCLEPTPFISEGTLTSGITGNRLSTTGVASIEGPNKAKLFVLSGNAVVQGTHMSDCIPEIHRVPTGPTPVFGNWKQQMLLATDKLGLRDVTLTPTEVWRTIRGQFYNDDNIIVQGATKKQVLGQLYRTRTKHFGRDVFRRIESEPLSDVKFSPGLKFFQFHFTYYQDEVLLRVIGWAHPQLMDRTKQRQCLVFVDATYRLVWIDVWKNDPTVRASSTLHPMILRRNTIPAHVVCDFELAMIKAVKNQFPESRIVGCLFHFKQAIRRKMLKIQTDELDLAMRPGCIDKLTVIRAIIKRDCENENIVYSKENWQQFWKYFKQTIIKLKPEWWNIYGLREDIVNRTNNPLERYNRTLNEAFLIAHPDVTQFIAVIERQAERMFVFLTTYPTAELEPQYMPILNEHLDLTQIWRGA